MTIEVYTHGNVSPSFRKLCSEIFENASKDAKAFPPRYDLHLCGTWNDGLAYKKSQVIIALKKIGSVPMVDFPFCVYAAETSHLDFPETIFVEEGMKQSPLKSLEELEGSVVHEEGHGIDYWINKKPTWFQSKSSLEDCVFFTKNEYEAEKNAIDVGYYSGVFARQFAVIADQLREAETLDFPNFSSKLAFIGTYAAFMKNNNPPQEQKQKLERAWNVYARSRRYQPSRDLLQSREIKEQPEIFRDEKSLRDFIFRKQFGWNFSLSKS
jgi:hypothetical protein